MAVYIDSHKRYGAPKIREVLVKTYPRLSVNRVQRHMKALGIRSIVHKKYKPYKSEPVYELGENLLKRDFSTTKPNEKWVADITYVHTAQDGWCYLASVLDLHLQENCRILFFKTMTKTLY
jgi:hypothetical protein